MLWEADEWTSNQVGTGITSWDNRLWWCVEDADLSVTHLVSYNPDTGAIVPEALAPTPSTGTNFVEASEFKIAAFALGSTAIRYYPDTAGDIASSGGHQDEPVRWRLDARQALGRASWSSSIRRLTVTAAASISSGRSTVSRTATSRRCRSDATSGTEYGIHAASRSISLKITLNKGTSTEGPTLRAIRLRGAPIKPVVQAGTVRP